MQEKWVTSIKKIQELKVDGSNYLSWAMDMKINLTSRNLGPTITTPLKMLQKCPRNTHVNTCRKNG
jgi:hypothetical protein